MGFINHVELMEANELTIEALEKEIKRPMFRYIYQVEIPGVTVNLDGQKDGKGRFYSKWIEQTDKSGVFKLRDTQFGDKYGSAKEIVDAYNGIVDQISICTSRE